MIFTLRTQRPFRGRIYTYKHFDRSPCFVQGSGGLTHRLRIPRADSSLTNCGTESLAGGNTQTNIVVVQNSQMVQTSKDMIYNLTCTLQTPGQSVVSSGYIGAGYARCLKINEFLDFFCKSAPKRVKFHKRSIKSWKIDKLWNKKKKNK